MRQIVCTGLSHNTAPVEVRERFAIPDQSLGETIGRIKSLPGVDETVILSTCNRVEIYAAVDARLVDFNGFAAVFHETSGTAPSDRGAFYRHLMPESIQHLFRVVCGMDSMVIGETEIAGQVKKAYQNAMEFRGPGKYLNRLFQSAFRVAKSVRSRTAITRGTVSVGSVAVDLAEQIFGNLKQCRVMIVGAGETGERTARSLISRGVPGVIVSNRSHDRAVALAAEMGGRAIRFEQWESEFATLDILISSTSAPHPIVTREKMEPMMRHRRHRPLFIIDIAVPRDVEPEVNTIEGIYLYDMDSLQEIARASMDSRRREIAACEVLVAESVAEFESWLESDQLFPRTTPLPDSSGSNTRQSSTAIQGSTE